MLNRTLAFAAALVTTIPLLAQFERSGCHYYHNKGPVRRELTPAERELIDETIARSDTFDIEHYDITLDVTNYSGQLMKAATTVTFHALMADQAFIRFDLWDLTVDSVVDAGGAMSYGYDGLYLRVDFEDAPVVGEEQRITVYYHGTPNRDPNWGGFYFQANYIYNLGIGLTTIPPNFGKVWYPCFDSFVERASYTYHVKSAGTFRLRGQGDFVGEEQLLGDTVVRSYHLPQEIPTHLSAIAVADYDDSTYIHTGANGDIPVTLSAKPAALAGMVSRFGDLGGAIDACEYWYGPYAYGRVGYVLTTDGALEISTNVAYPDFMPSQNNLQNRKLYSHELGHHWWGDVVTPYVHNDMWLKEGPAEYSAHLVDEWVSGRAAFISTVKGNLLDIMTTAHIDDDGFQALSPMPDEHIYGTHTYNKGAAVVHNLRGYLGDEAFRNAMRDVQAQYANTAITSVDFKNALEAVSGADLDPFFDAWVFAPGYSVFEVRSFTATPSGGEWEVDLNLGQKLYGATVYHTDVPLDLTLLAADGATFETLITGTGQFSTAQVQCPFEPVMAVLNRYQRLNQARMDTEITLVPGVSFSNSLPYVEFRVYQNTLVDSTLVRVDHIWSGADTDAFGAGIVEISGTHYWNVDGLWPEGTSLQGRLLYFGGSATQFDHDLIDGNETGMVVVHRPNADSNWQVYADQTVNTGSTTNGTGTITMNTLAKGQYAFAKILGAIGIPERDGGAFTLFPVPTNDQLTVVLDRRLEAVALLDVIGTDGKLMQRSTLGAGAERTMLDVAALAAGSYRLAITTTGGERVGVRSFQVVRLIPGPMSFNAVGRRKPLYKVEAALDDYLHGHGRMVALPLAYADLARYDGSLPQRGADGRETLWNTVFFRPQEQAEIHERLVETYQLLIADGRHIDHLQVAGVDLCPYGNSQPFRVKVHNRINDNHDYFYIKRTDASRVYGLELEHLLSPNRINYLVDGATLLEEHIIGVPGDTFIIDPSRYGGGMNAVRLCKEFVKFNERCFIRLLGDMRAYNFVVDVIHDLDQVQYRIRTIDMDQQSFEGRLRIYLPQFYKENLPYVELAQRVIGLESAEQYRNEERSLMRRRYKLAQDGVDELITVMSGDTISPHEHVRQLADELSVHHGQRTFTEAPSMGALLRMHLAICLGDA